MCYLWRNYNPTPGLLAINDCVFRRNHWKVVFTTEASAIFIGNLPTKDGLPVNPYYFDTLPEYLQVLKPQPIHDGLLGRLN
ncbi:MAG: hypothetical protein ACE5J9_09245 [Methanosarcinales archaeon]